MSMYKNNHTKKPSDIPTPLPVCDYLYEILKGYDPKVILDPCAGDKRLTKDFKNATIINYEIKDGTDFFKVCSKINCSLVIMNPPFNGTRPLFPEKFLDHVLNLVGFDTPILMFAPFGFRLNNHKKSERYKKLSSIYPKITTIITLPIDIFDLKTFHTEILIFNGDKLTTPLPPHLMFQMPYHTDTHKSPKSVKKHSSSRMKISYGSTP